VRNAGSLHTVRSWWRCYPAAARSWWGWWGCYCVNPCVGHGLRTAEVQVCMSNANANQNAFPDCYVIASLHAHMHCYCWHLWVVVGSCSCGCVCIPTSCSAVQLPHRGLRECTTVQHQSAREPARLSTGPVCAAKKSRKSDQVGVGR
jgi:hypothetical protein